MVEMSRAVNNRGVAENSHLFQPGQSGNPNGRPVGSKNKFTLVKQQLVELFEEEQVKEKLREWIKSGRRRDLKEFMNFVISILPREIEGSDNRPQVVNIINSWSGNKDGSKKPNTVRADPQAAGVQGQPRSQ